MKREIKELNSKIRDMEERWISMKNEIKDKISKIEKNYMREIREIEKKEK